MVEAARIVEMVWAKPDIIDLNRLPVKRAAGGGAGFTGMPQNVP